MGERGEHVCCGCGRIVSRRGVGVGRCNFLGKFRRECWGWGGAVLILEEGWNGFLVISFPIKHLQIKIQ